MEPIQILFTNSHMSLTFDDTGELSCTCSDCMFCDGLNQEETKQLYQNMKLFYQAECKK